MKKWVKIERHSNNRPDSSFIALYGRIPAFLGRYFSTANVSQDHKNDRIEPKGLDNIAKSWYNGRAFGKAFRAEKGFP